MREQELSKIFTDFLNKEKGFPKESFLSESPITQKIGAKSRMFIADLILLDTNDNNYLALVEFKGSSRLALSNYVTKIKIFLNIIDKPIPAYVVIPDGAKENNPFKIFVLKNDTFKQIELSDFPQYETIISKNRADEKKEYRDFEDIKEKEIKKKKEIIRGTAISSILSLIVAIFSVLIISNNLFTEDNRDFSFLKQYFEKDSINNLQNEITKKISILEGNLKNIQKQDSLFKISTEKTEILYLKNRINNIESSISQTPEKLFKTQELLFQIEFLKNEISNAKELNEVKFNSLKDRIDQLTLWISGILITLIGSISGFAINTFKKS
jgi:hypothetical protein